MNPPQIQPKQCDMEEEKPQKLGARLSVNLRAVGANYAELQHRASPAKVAPVVKADAYGLGVEPIARKLASDGADSFFVARLEEGIALRSIAPGARIFVFDGLVQGAASAYVAHRLIPVLNSPEELAEYAAHAANCRRTLDAAIQIDTGINRSGLSNEDVGTIAANARESLSDLNLVLIMSHLACADDPSHELNRKQLERFRAALQVLPPAPASLAATAGMELGKEFLFDIVRPGIGLYGGNPHGAHDRSEKAILYAPVAALHADVLQIRHVGRGETVGYGASFRAERPARLAIVPLGYADGLIRAMGAKGAAAIGGIRVPFAGRISMDLATLDVTTLPEDKCTRGTEVEFLGKTILLDEVAYAAGTVSHEVLTSLSSRATRSYVED